MLKKRHSKGNVVEPCTHPAGNQRWRDPSNPEVCDQCYMAVLFLFYCSTSCPTPSPPFFACDRIVCKGNQGIFKETKLPISNGGGHQQENNK